MDYRSLHIKTVAELRQLAKDNGVKFPAGIKKEDMIARILEREASEASKAQINAEEKQSAKTDKEPAVPAENKTAEASSEKQDRVRTRKKNERASGTVQAEKPAVQPQTAENGEVHENKPAQPAEQADISASVIKETEKKPESTAKQQPAAAGQNHIYRRSLSTQQRMGARTQPVQNAYRPQSAKPGMQTVRTQSRFTGDAGQRLQKNYDNRQRETRNFEPRSFEAKTSEPRNAELKNAVPREPRPIEGASDVQNADVKPAEQRTYESRSTVRESENSHRVLPGEGIPDQVHSVNPAVPDLLAAGDCGDGEGILEIHQDGYGFLRADNYLPGNRDVYVSAAQIRRFNLRTGDYVVGKTRAQQSGDRSVGLIYISEVNGLSPDMARNRRPFDSLIPVYPDQRLRMECADQKEISLRLIDLIAPIGKGQRGMIVSPPKAGKTTLLKKIANAITKNNPDVHLIVLLIDERPEEVTDMKRSIQGEVVYSTFDEAPENHTRVSEMVLERAQRLVELGKDVVVLLDSITRLARAYNLVIPPTGRSLSGGLDPGALYKPKRFFGAARNIENGGSLTVIATALVDTGSRMDDIIFEEFKGTGNMELHLDRSLSDRRIFPAIDLYKSGTRREELLLSKAELDCAYQMRRLLSKGSAQESVEQLISYMEKTRTNEEFCLKLKSLMSVYEKDGFTLK